MAAFETRHEPQGLFITLGNPSALNDFRTNAFRDALFEVVRPIEHPHVAVNLGAIDYLASSGVAILIGLKRRIERAAGQARPVRRPPLRLRPAPEHEVDAILHVHRDRG